MTNKQAAIMIIRKLRKAGFEALLAGGCVRDMLCGKRPKDHDVATSATPTQVCRIFRRTIKVGAKFGVVIVLIDNQQVEVATFRSDVSYSDGRRPDKVRFTSAKEDALRRDFTINGMFYDPLKKEVIDYVGSRDDLRKKTIKTIGKPAERFSEDYLRMLRAVRFSAQLGFKIEKNTLIAVKKHADKITKISGERIAVELESLCTAHDRNKGVKLLIETGLLKNIFPVFKKSAPAEFGLKVFSFLPKKIIFPLAVGALFSGCKTRDVMENLKVLKLSRNQLKHIKFLLDKRDYLLGQLPLAQLKMIAAEPYFEDLYSLQKAIRKAEKKSIAPLLSIRRRANALADKVLKPKSLLDGYEIIKLGAESGPQVGLISKELYIEQLSERITAKNEAVKWVENWLKKHKE
ncbi:MAG: CCA tRNA nucleotidyltransferase [Sedimentisphaerales bacterium]|nr:CCA tRNA nucleotidyltransferase [Sedimentisphaerales bacterium]